MAGQRIALLLYTLYGAGAPRVMLNLARAFASQGRPVDLLVCRMHPHFADDVPPGVRLIALPARRRLPAQLRATARDFLRYPSLLLSLATFRRARFLPALVEYLRAERPEVLLAAATYSNALAVFAKRLSGVETRIVLSQHNHLSAKVERPLKRWKLPLVRSLYPEADAVVAVSQGVAHDLVHAAGIPSDRIATIYNPVQDAELIEKSRAPLDHPWLGEGGPPVVLGAGRLTARKDFATLMRAFRRLCGKLDARLVILGEGVERPRLEALARELGIADRVELPGFVRNPYAYMSRASVFVLCSRWEGFGIVLAEAIACGCPVVATDCRSGPSEILEGGRYGPLVPIGDDAALAEAISATLEKPPQRDWLKGSGARFDVGRIADQYLQVMLG